MGDYWLNQWTNHKGCGGCDVILPYLYLYYLMTISTTYPTHFDASNESAQWQRTTEHPKQQPTENALASQTYLSATSPHPIVDNIPKKLFLYTHTTHTLVAHETRLYTTTVVNILIINAPNLAAEKLYTHTFWSLPDTDTRRLSRKLCYHEPYSIYALL